MPANVPFTARISVPDGVLMRDLDGESVVLNVQTERYYGLDAVGTRMWTVLSSADSIQAAFDTLLGEYEVEATQLHADLEKFVGELADHGLLILHE